MVSRVKVVMIVHYPPSWQIAFALQSLGPLGRLVAAIKESLRRLLGVLEEESRNGDTHNMSKIDLAAWHRHIKQGHIPFRADCRICGEAMGCDKPHKRLGGSATKFTMSADLCGPFPAGRDLGAGVTCKYALISTVAVPIISELPGEVAVPYDTADDVKHTEDLPCDPEEREMLPDDEVQRLNELAQIEEAQEAPELWSLWSVPFHDYMQSTACWASKCTASTQIENDLLPQSQFKNGVNNVNFD